MSTPSMWIFARRCLRTLVIGTSRAFVFAYNLPCQETRTAEEGEPGTRIPFWFAPKLLRNLNRHAAL